MYTSQPKKTNLRLASDPQRIATKHCQMIVIQSYVYSVFTICSLTTGVTGVTGNKQVSPTVQYCYGVVFGQASPIIVLPDPRYLHRVS
jgi:hypothetical protein